MALFSRRKDPVVALVHLNARLQPKHRGSAFEDPLDELLAQHAPGSEVVGGGTQFTADTGPLSCDIEVSLAGDPVRTLALVVDMLEHLGAPIGSWAQLPGGAQHPFGVTHGLALAFDGTSLPDEVYADNDVNDLIAALDDALGASATLLSWWEGPQLTVLFYYGRDPGRMHAVLSSAANLSPLSQGSTVTSIT